MLGKVGKWTCSGKGVSTSPGRASHLPAIAVRKTLPRATASIDDAA
jgi:hypothetical protein